tara:strand:- start:256 stop:618 length:363 start_codon:yes stop_codon:yes gene_type:complete
LIYNLDGDEMSEKSKQLAAIEARIDMGRLVISYLQSKIHNLSKLIAREMELGGSTEGYRIGDWEYKSQKIGGYTSEIQAALTYCIQLEKMVNEEIKEKRELIKNMDLAEVFGPIKHLPID